MALDGTLQAICAAQRQDRQSLPHWPPSHRAYRSRMKESVMPPDPTPDKDAADDVLTPQDWIPLAVEMEREGKEAEGLACGELCIRGSNLIADLAKRLVTAHCRITELRKQASEIAALHSRVAQAEDSAAESWRLSHEWMVKHDKLLGFIQKRPTMLKELIESER